MNWRTKQWKDHFYRMAPLMNYRARSAFKLLQIHNKFKVFTKNSTVIDLGCAPGSWMQVSKEMGASFVVGIDLLPIKPIPGTYFGQIDFMNNDLVDEFLLSIKSPNFFDLVLSDMAPDISGIPDLDLASSLELVSAVLKFGNARLKKGGSIIIKCFECPDLHKLTRGTFNNIRFFKPTASRSDSTEIYLIAINN